MTTLAPDREVKDYRSGPSGADLSAAEEGMRTWEMLDEADRSAVRDTYADLGPVPAAVLQELLSDPEHGRHRDYRQADLPDSMRPYAYPQQSWPTLVGRDKLERLWGATSALVELVRGVPERIFDNDPQRIAEVYPVADPMLVRFGLEEPNGLHEGVARVDLLDDGERLLGLEINMGAFLGGWQTWFWTAWWLDFPPVAEVLRRHDADVRLVNPILSHLRQAVDAVLRTTEHRDGETNLLLVVEPEYLGMSQLMVGVMNDFYQQALAERGLEGELMVDVYSDRVRRRGGRLWHLDRPLRCVFQYAAVELPVDVFRAFKGREICLFNPPIYRWLGDKALLALLSEHEESDRYDAAERALIRAHVPWSRKAREGSTTFRGETADLRKLLLGDRRSFVVKEALGSQGDGVVVGPRVSDQEWRRAVDVALSEPGWLAQEYVESRPYLFQCGARGHAICDTVWGIFSSGRNYGGGFTRMLPRHLGGDGVINSARGALEGLLIEVEDVPAS